MEKSDRPNLRPARSRSIKMGQRLLLPWKPLLQAGSLPELLRGCIDEARRLIGPARVSDCWFIVPDAENQPPCWLLLTGAARRARYSLHCPLAPEAVETLRAAKGVAVWDGLPQSMIDPALRPQADEPEFLPAKTLAVAIGADPAEHGLLLVSVTGAEPIPGEALEPLEQGGMMLALVLHRVLKCDRLAQINTQLRQLHETLQQGLTASDEPELLSACLQVATRHFGFDRVLMALLSDEASLATAVHTGFGEQPPPAVLSPSQHDFFLPLLKRGELLLDEGLGEAAGLAWPRFGGREPLRRAFFPLLSGGRRLGMLYADQFDSGGAPLHKDVMELFARQTGLALENLKLRLQAERRAETDPLTGLHNRAYLDRLLEIEIPRVRRYNHPISILMIDLFDFKRVNDTWGHQFGDALLRETGQLLKANVRRPDVVVRYGGDEFVVVMLSTGPAQAELVRQRIEKAFIERNRLQEDERRMIHISAGLRSADAATLGDLLFDADKAMYAQKARQKRRALVSALIGGAPEKIEAADRVVGNLCMMLYKKAPFYPGHARGVAALAALTGQRIGMCGDELELLVLAALLHGIGKVSLPSEILMKTQPLTEAERLALQTHVQIGEEFFEGLEHLEPLRPVLRSHHERYDGLRDGVEFPGYPHGLSGDRIPIQARILRLAETAQTLTGGRPWRLPLPADEVAAIINAESGKSFDPRLVTVLLAGGEWRRAIEEPLDALASFR